MTITWPGTSFNGRTCAVTTGSPTVSVSGNLATDIGYPNPGASGNGFRAPDEKIYCISSALSYDSSVDRTTFTLNRNYEGSTIASRTPVTMTIASPAVITWTAHGLVAGDPVKFTTTGALPTGVVSGTTYYVSSSGLTTDTFKLSDTAAHGIAGTNHVNSSGSQSGVHTGKTVPDTGDFDIVPAQGLSANAAYALSQLLNRAQSNLKNVVTDYGADNAGVTDCAGIFNTLGAQGGVYFVPAGRYLMNSSISCPVTTIFIGAGSSEFSDSAAANPAVTDFYFTATDSADRIVFGDGITQTWGHGLKDIRVVAPNATGGAIVFVNFASQVSLFGLRFNAIGETEIGIKAWKTNCTWIDDVRVELPTSQGFYGYADGIAERSDSIEFRRFIVTGNANGAGTRLPNGIELDGCVNTITGDNILAIFCGRGIYRHNNIGSADAGNFDYFVNFQCDFPKYEAARYESGTEIRFVNSYFHGSETEHGITLVDIPNGASTALNTVVFNNCKISGHWKNGVYVAVDNVEFCGGTRVDHNSIASSGTWSGVGIAPGASRVVVNANVLAVDNPETHAYGVRVDAGSPSPVNYRISDNCILAGATAPIGDFVGDRSAPGSLRTGGAATWNPGNLSSGNQTSTTVTCNGAVVQDRPEVQANITLSGLHMWGEVTAANTVTVYLSNMTGSAVDLASMNINVTVRQ